MSNKFTEEQYHEIIKAWRSRITYSNKTNAVIDCLIDDLNLDVTLFGDEALALANPKTREWAHEQYVEKEKKYVWSLKVDSEFCLFNDGIVVNLGMHNQSKLTESEVKEWGYNQEMFDREEV